MNHKCKEMPKNVKIFWYDSRDQTAWCMNIKSNDKWFHIDTLYECPFCRKKLEAVK